MFIFQSDADSFAQAAQGNNTLSFRSCKRRLGRSKQEWGAELNTLKPDVENSFLKSLEIDGDVREFRHAGNLGYQESGGLEKASIYGRCQP